MEQSAAPAALEHAERGSEERALLDALLDALLEVLLVSIRNHLAQRGGAPAPRCASAIGNAPPT